MNRHQSIDTNPEMTSTQVLMGGLAAALLWCAEAPATAPATGPQDQPSPLELARAALDQPGADHRLERENAVKTLLSMTGQPAHIALQDRLRDGHDTDNVSLYILDELDRRISHPNDSLFGISNGDAGAMLLKSYVPALVSAFIEEGPDAEVEKHRRLRVKALDCLLHMPARARLEGLQAMLAPGIQDLEMQRAALRAAASCRETGLARLLGDQLQGELREIAQQGLKQLTFENFGTGREGKTDFDKWWNDNSGKTYLELVEAECLAIGIGIASSLGASGRGLVQACQPRRGGRRGAIVRFLGAGLRCPGPRAFPPGIGLSAGPPGRPQIFLRRSRGLERSRGRGHRQPAQRRSERRRDRSGIRGQGPGNTERKKGGQVPRARSGPRLSGARS